MSPRQIVIDTDPGLDDAIAILFALASPALSVAAVTTVAGNIGLERTTRNAGRLLAAAGHDTIPVAAGASQPLVGRGISEEAIHGDDGLGGVPLPGPMSPPVATPAARFLAEMLMSRPAGSIDILALGPLTNVALLLDESPEAAGRIGRIIAMGGAVNERGNVGPRSEFNLACDPEAAARVLESGLDVTLVPLDVTRKVRADRDYLDRLRSSGTLPGAVAADLIAAYFAGARDQESRPLHDPCVMLLAVQPALFDVRRMRLAIDCGNGVDRGALAPSSEVPEIAVAMDVDAKGALELLAQTLT
ncbi:nucleoside hydrolase [Chelativorans sp. ZYF759]|uniref:nucleoside hydrolase n=1 Tax=Chelativorans sp. ZYF759 TaxID=2692213 RepID=UPI00145D7837|nr:nucleoside hydrolase [Chelativorans sp. ZYF759]NMG39647.1 nucleoside hydrolase [Chelativorans sp. ZYF759]